MHRRAYFAAALTAALLVQAPFALAKTPAKPAVAALTPAASPESAGFDSARLKMLDAAMAKVVADGRVAGMTTLLARHGKVVAFNTYGKTALEGGKPMPKDEIFRIYSMSKPLTG
ncbi:MAG TPA: serine hydrolase domain-containing protein, partial [Phenylobacterium sp.]|nr:serine hydrolase domain-containing protein [Phenylobacterium sp.]